MSVVPRLRNPELKIGISLLPHLKNVYFTYKRNIFIFIFLYRHTDLVSHCLDNTLKMGSTSYIRKNTSLRKIVFFLKERNNCERAVFSFIFCFFLFFFVGGGGVEVGYLYHWNEMKIRES